MMRRYLEVPRPGGIHDVLATASDAPELQHEYRR